MGRQAPHTVTRIGGGRFLGVGPKHGPRGAPLVLDDAELLVGTGAGR
ncbi:hypothetical protein GCM10010112_40750 [Actinoplanes lobatus]|uniref:Uncharacterized protein n=1 Tax=Actinoplanes lobatus TaxID=113568 RepID=A0A7W7ML65_9ACTN|nr:hypothetical protein [Actinoplanes lobatus]MBB4753810.1 hypothetical protein [Actinoplanes lobatus]GGN72454.1 hypothetical protein GCM10010112_40750 [Actinoplanes lobatus]GIE42037.1 hypothetical protein Alo02nite_49350 [Actinoplanes lobatus]